MERSHYPPFGDAHGHIDAHTALGREGPHVVQFLTGQKLHAQTMLPTSHWEVTSSQQTGTLHTKKDTLKQPLYREPFVLRFHPEGVNFTQQPQGEYGCLKGLSYTQDAYTAKNTLAQYTAENTPTHFGEFTAQECGRMEEFLVRVYDPYGVQHFVAYRDEDLIQYFLSDLPSPSYLNWLSATKASPWNPPRDSKTAISPRSLFPPRALQEPIGCPFLSRTCSARAHT